MWWHSPISHPDNPVHTVNTECKTLSNKHQGHMHCHSESVSIMFTCVRSVQFQIWCSWVSCMLKYLHNKREPWQISFLNLKTRPQKRVHFRFFYEGDCELQYRGESALWSREKWRVLWIITLLSVSASLDPPWQSTFFTSVWLDVGLASLVVRYWQIPGWVFSPVFFFSFSWVGSLILTAPDCQCQS